MKPQYEIGQDIFYAAFNSYKSEYVTCPDCGGTGRLRVTFCNETTVSIPCANCAHGYDEPTGKIMVYCRKGEVIKCQISGIEISDGEVEYRAEYYTFDDQGRTFRGCRCIKEEDVFLSETEAQARADKLAADYDAEERAKIFRKEKNQRSWAWNASYHRKQIKDAERSLEYHRKKLAHAALKTKEKTEV
jgi:hypothetical protein